MCVLRLPSVVGPLWALEARVSADKLWGCWWLLMKVYCPFLDLCSPWCVCCSPGSLPRSRNGLSWGGARRGHWGVGLVPDQRVRVVEAEGRRWLDRGEGGLRNLAQTRTPTLAWLFAV